MSFGWLLILAIFDGYAISTGNLEHSSRSIKFVEPQMVEHRETNDNCQLFCKDWRTPFYESDVGGCVTMNDSMAGGDYIFCPDIEVIKSWTKEDELEYQAFFRRLVALEDSEYEVLKELMLERKLRLSIHPWNNAVPVQSQDDDLRRLQENVVIRRRPTYYGRTNSFICFGGNGGRWAARMDLRRQPLSVHVRHGSLIDQLKFWYMMSMFGAPYPIGSGGSGGQLSKYDFRSFYSGCVDRVDLRSGSLLDGIRFRGGSKYTPWYGGHGGGYYVISAPRDRCLGDVQMRTGSLVDKICLKFNAYRCKPCTHGQC